MGVPPKFNPPGPFTVLLRDIHKIFRIKFALCATSDQNYLMTDLSAPKPRRKTPANPPGLAAESVSLVSDPAITTFNFFDALRLIRESGQRMKSNDPDLAHLRFIDGRLHALHKRSGQWVSITSLEVAVFDKEGLVWEIVSSRPPEEFTCHCRGVDVSQTSIGPVTTFTLEHKFPNPEDFADRKVKISIEIVDES